jgi:type IV secretion system protein VirD4
VRDVQNVADILVDPEGSLERRNHWEKTSHSLLVGSILHVLYAEADKTLAGVAAFLSDPRRSIEMSLRAMMTTPHLGKAGPHPVIASAARELLNKSENERSGVLSTAMSFLGLYRDPVVGQVTRRCDWRIADLIAGDRPATLYLVIPPSDISRTKPLIRLVLNQIGRRLTEQLHPKNRRHRMLLMLDEFPALGRLDFFESALAFMAGYRIKSVLIAQSLNQIEKAYGPNNSILDNCHVRVCFATNDERTARRVSDALGVAGDRHSSASPASQCGGVPPGCGGGSTRSVNRRSSKYRTFFARSGGEPDISTSSSPGGSCMTSPGVSSGRGVSWRDTMMWPSQGASHCAKMVCPGRKPALRRPGNGK